MMLLFSLINPCTCSYSTLQHFQIIIIVIDPSIPITQYYKVPGYVCIHLHASFPTLLLNMSKITNLFLLIIIDHSIPIAYPRLSITHIQQVYTVVLQSLEARVTLGISNACRYNNYYTCMYTSVPTPLLELSMSKN